MAKRRTQYETFLGRFKPMMSESDKDLLKRFEFTDTLPYGDQRVWTVIEADNGKQYISPGYHIVNRLYYIVSQEPWPQDESGVDYLY